MPSYWIRQQYPSQQPRYIEGEKRNEYVDKARNEKIKKENMKKNENKYPENII